MKIGRNETCPCGSGQKYKKCCSAKDEAAHAEALAKAAAQPATATTAAGEESGDEAQKPIQPIGAQWKTKPKGPLSALKHKRSV